MAVTKKNGSWNVDVRPLGIHGPRIRKTSIQTKAEAMRYEAYVIEKTAKDKEWNPTHDSRRMTELIAIWYDNHGLTLKDGERRNRRLISTAKELGGVLN